MWNAWVLLSQLLFTKKPTSYIVCKKWGIFNYHSRSMKQGGVLKLVCNIKLVIFLLCISFVLFKQLQLRSVYLGSLFFFALLAFKSLTSSWNFTFTSVTLCQVSNWFNSKIRPYCRLLFTDVYFTHILELLLMIAHSRSVTCVNMSALLLHRFR